MADPASPHNSFTGSSPDSVKAIIPATGDMPCCQSLGVNSLWRQPGHQAGRHIGDASFMTATPSSPVSKTASIHAT
ncbi:hypothetical protein [Pectobacterium sp. LFLA-215]|uniref:hypothetical protein n=1 Tax=Pectobacterium sp. LFLA-215 TaxID=3419008 RepID=UPI003F5B8FB1